MNARGKFRYTLLLAGSLCTAAPSFAAEPAETVETRISRLEKELAELKALVGNKPAAAATADTQTAPVKKADTATPVTLSTTSGANVQFYGFARFDASYDTNPISPGNVAFWALPENGRNDSEWNLTAGATRIGMNISGPDTESLKLSGNIEFDFLTSVSTENNQAPRLRHGYVKAYWPASDFSILAGQTWDVVSSLIPFVDDPALMWDAGNIGSRHPQVRLTKGFSTGNKGRLEVAVAASRTIGDRTAYQTLALQNDTGKDAAIPSIQGRVAFSEPLIVKNQPATVAISGHYGQEEWDTNSTGSYKTLDSWSCNLELSMPLCEKILLAGEYFTGSNLDDYFGGIGQGVNSAVASNPKEIRAQGGWGALKYTINPVTSVSLGAGVDDPNDKDLAAGARSRNQSIFANVITKITPNFILGLQLSDWKTDYKNAAGSDALRAQSSLTYKF
jgi:DcaP outer membrane protein